MSRTITVDAGITNLTSVVMNATGSVQYVASAAGGILKSTDYGVTFTDITTGTAYETTVFTRLQTSSDGLTVIGRASNSDIVRSVNGGSTFSTMSGVSARLFAMCYNNPDRIVLLNDVDAVWEVQYTTDGGNSWQTTDWSSVFSTGLGVNNVSDVEFTANGLILIVSIVQGANKGDPGAILKYTIGSAWTDVTTGIGALSSVVGYEDVSISSDGSTIVGMAYMGGGGTSHNIAYSSDGGSSWSLTSVPGGYDPSSVAISISVDGGSWFVPSGNRMYYTTNAGSSWTLSPAPTDPNVGGSGYISAAASINGDYVSVVGTYAMYHFNVVPPVPCFPPGARIATPEGYKPVESIKTGDLLLTADGRQVPIIAFATRVHHTSVENAPYVVHADAFGPSNPPQDIQLSPWHAFQVGANVWQKPAIASLYSKQVKQYDIGKDVTYYHFEAPNYLRDNFLVNGTVVESYANCQLEGVNPYTYDRERCVFMRSRNGVSKPLPAAYA